MTADLLALVPLVLLLAGALWRPDWWDRPLTPKTWNGPLSDHGTVRNTDSGER